MQETWNRIESWLRANATTILATLKSGAALEEILEIEAHFGVELQNSVKASFLVHDGQASSGPPLMYGNYYLIPLSEIPAQWQVFRDIALKNNFFAGDEIAADPAIQSVWWHEKWIPIAVDDGGWIHCLDFAPTHEGKYGQIIEMRHDDARRLLIAPSFSDWLGRFADDLEKGVYIYNPNGYLEENASN